MSLLDEYRKLNEDPEIHAAASILAGGEENLNKVLGISPESPKEVDHSKYVFAFHEGKRSLMIQGAASPFIKPELPAAPREVFRNILDLTGVPQGMVSLITLEQLNELYTGPWELDLTPVYFNTLEEFKAHCNF